MSRRAAKFVQVLCTPEGVPAVIVTGRTRLLVCGVADRWREWFDVLDGEPEHEVWVLDTDGGVCEVHGLRPCPSTESPPGEEDVPCAEWLLCRWED